MLTAEYFDTLLTGGQNQLHLDLHIFGMYILMIFRKFVSKGICYQYYFEVIRVFSKPMYFNVFYMFCDENSCTQRFNV